MYADAGVERIGISERNAMITIGRKKRREPLQGSFILLGFVNTCKGLLEPVIVIILQ
jgi:hypothetical protein